MKTSNFTVTFWGVRGSRPVPGPSTVKYGGNTACVQIQAGKKLLILDAGSGISNLGNVLFPLKEPVEAEIFFSHFHWDHVQGLPFFTPLYQRKNSFTLYGEAKEGVPFSAVLRQQISPPSFPITFDDMKAELTMREVASEQVLPLSGDVVVRTLRVKHPNLCLAYRVEYQGSALCYLTDMEHSPTIDNELREFVRGAQAVIYDAHFTEEEYQSREEGYSKKGWGHSTWQAGIKLVRAAGAEKLILFHHSPERTDRELESLEKKAAQEYDGVIAAKEGMTLWL